MHTPFQRISMRRQLMHMERFRARIHTLELITMDSEACAVVEHAMHHACEHATGAHEYATEQMLARVGCTGLQWLVSCG